MPKIKQLAPDAVRFIIAGLINTGLTSALYFLLVLVMMPEFAYAMSWLAGLIFVVIVYPDKVFVGGRDSAADRIKYGAATLGVFLLGLVVLRLLVALTGSAQLAFVITLVCTTAANFAVGRLVLRR